jgi:hypothetical protein
VSAPVQEWNSLPSPDGGAGKRGQNGRRKRASSAVAVWTFQASRRTDLRSVTLKSCPTATRVALRQRIIGSAIVGTVVRSAITKSSLTKCSLESREIFRSEIIFSFCNQFLSFSQTLLIYVNRFPILCSASIAFDEGAGYPCVLSFSSVDS